MKEANISYFPPVFHMSDVIMASPEAAMHWRKDLSQLRLFSSTSWLQNSWRDCLASRGGFTCLSTCGPVLLLNLLFGDRGEDIIGIWGGMHNREALSHIRDEEDVKLAPASQHPWGTLPIWEWEWTASACLGPAANAKVLQKSNEPGMSPESNRLLNDWEIIWNLPWSTPIENNFALPVGESICHQASLACCKSVWKAGGFSHGWSGHHRTYWNPTAFWSTSYFAAVGHPIINCFYGYLFYTPSQPLFFPSDDHSLIGNSPLN